MSESSQASATADIAYAAEHQRLGRFTVRGDVCHIRAATSDESKKVLSGEAEKELFRKSRSSSAVTQPRGGLVLGTELFRVRGGVPDMAVALVRGYFDHKIIYCGDAAYLLDR